MPHSHRSHCAPASASRKADSHCFSNRANSSSRKSLSGALNPWFPRLERTLKFRRPVRPPILDGPAIMVRGIARRRVHEIRQQGVLHRPRRWRRRMKQERLRAYVVGRSDGGRYYKGGDGKPELHRTALRPWLITSTSTASPRFSHIAAAAGRAVRRPRPANQRCVGCVQHTLGDRQFKKKRKWVGSRSWVARQDRTQLTGLIAAPFGTVVPFRVCSHAAARETA